MGASTILVHLHRVVVLLFALAVGVAPETFAQRFDRAQVEAAYLLSFMRYTEWPPGALPPPEAPIVVVVYRSSATAEALETIAASGELVAGREIEVRRARTAERLARQLAGAHVLYVGAAADATDALARTEALVLTIGAGPEFARQGGMLALVPLGNRIVFDANLAAIRVSGLKISAKVLALARRVEGGP